MSRLAPLLLVALAGCAMGCAALTGLTNFEEGDDASTVDAAEDALDTGHAGGDSGASDTRADADAIASDVPLDTATATDSGKDDAATDTLVADSGVDTGVDVVFDACTTPVTHKNCVGSGCGTLGQSYVLADPPPDDACRPLGVPGTASTYDFAMAGAARDAWPSGGTLSTISCSGANALCKNAVGFGATWLYEGPNAGHVVYTAAKCGPSFCCCPAGSDPTWN